MGAKQMDVVTMKIADIHPYQNNPRRNDAAVQSVANSIRQFGWKQPIVVDKDHVIIVGHTRYKAAQKLGIREVPVLVAEDLDPEKVKAYRLADNKTNELAVWDYDLLDIELGNISDIDMSDFGFDIPDNLEDNVEDDHYKVAPPEIPQAVRGNIYQLGEHILMCGDSTDPDDVAALTHGEKAPLLFTSPPYSDIREYNGDKDLDVNHIASFICAYAESAAVQAVNIGIQRKDHEVVQYWDEYIEVAHSSGLKLLAWNVWDKMMVGSIGQQDAMIPVRHEWIFVFGEKPVQINLTWEKKQSSVYGNGRRRRVRQKDGSLKSSTCGVSNKRWKKMESLVKIPEKETIDSVTEQVSETGAIRSKHPATFPVFLPAEYIIAFTEQGESVIEPFGGSGTTLIACEQLRRKCLCMELDPAYVDVIIDRWETMTGKKAVLLNGQ